MKKSLMISLMVAALVCAFALPSVVASNNYDAIMTVKVPEGVTKTKAVAPFPHKQHTDAKIDCFVCHHKSETKDQIKSCSAEGCHTDASPAAKKDPKGYYQAFHSKKNEASCLACHKKEKKADKAFVGPVSCKDCHPKDKK